MWEEQNYSEAFAKKQIVPAENILTYLDSTQSVVIDQSETDRNWVKNFCSAKKSKWFVEIDDDFLKDQRNYENIKITLEKYYNFLCSKNKFDFFYTMAIYLIRTKNEKTLTEEDEKKDSQIYSLSEEDEITLENFTETLYGLLHARYILTSPGLIKMAQKFQRFEFGRCLRIGCKSTPVLPIGLSDKPKQFPVKIFCPLCHDIYNLPDEFEFLENTDGAFFGKTFPSVFMLSFPQFCDEDSYIYPNGPAIYKKRGKDEYVIYDENQKEHFEDVQYEPLTFNRRTVLLSSENL
ncbi:hypothetical protein M9Y10_041348 [Tritrichomonas musculus]|uniref:Casein kinase II subunit beta n=1 Tax=Tritrichomonas musculus TaxID=1915356 RepID=A0ABR2K559_9EUKA